MILDFNDYITRKTGHFTGREWVFQAINSWLEPAEDSRYFLMTGEPGSGKSAVAAMLANFSSGKDHAPGGCDHLNSGFLNAIHFCSTSDATWIDPRIFARSVALSLSGIEEFKSALINVGDRDVNIDVRIKAGSVQSGANIKGVVIENLIIQNLSGQEAFNRTVLEPLHTIYENGYNRPIIILVDSLDEALSFSAEKKIVDLLASIGEIDRRVRFILTSRQEPRVENKFTSVKRLFLSDQKFKSENDSDIAAYVERRLLKEKELTTSADLLPPGMKEVLPAYISDKADGNFQYVSFLLDSVAKGHQSLLNPDVLPTGLDSLYYESLQRVVDLGNKDRDKVYKPFLGILSVALEPLTLELLQTYTGSATTLWNIYLDLFQFVEAVPASSQTIGNDYKEDRYKLYHQSVIDFLHKQQWMDPVDNVRKPNIYFINPTDCHVQIVSACEKSKGSWDEVDWTKAAPYTLRYLVTHLYHLHEADGYSDKLHSLLENRSFIDQHLAVLGKPYLLLDDLRLALKIALGNHNLAMAWNHIREYRRILRHQMEFKKLMTAVKTANLAGDYNHIMERTALYGFMPNSQALTRLWIAWHAAVSGHINAAESIIKNTIENISPRGKVQFQTSRAGSLPIHSVEDAIGETFQRLLVRIVRTVKNTTLSQTDWLRKIMISWPLQTIEAVIGRLSEQPDTWGKLFSSGGMNQTMEDLFLELQDRRIRLDGDMSGDSEEVYFYQKRLAAGIIKYRKDPGWLEYVQRSVTFISLDDYPSYREMALFWIASACLTNEDSYIALEALSTVLGGIFKPSPGFWGDTVISATEGKAKEEMQETDAVSMVNLLEHLEATGEKGIDGTLFYKSKDVIRWRESVGLPGDPWSFNIRRQSAVAAVLYRRNNKQSAEDLLRKACTEGARGSYAGYRALARLSLACRWLEWRCFPEAILQVNAAREDAIHMRDHALLLERLNAVENMGEWINHFAYDPSVLAEEDAFLEIQKKQGIERGLFIEFLSALWSDRADRLIKLLLLTLDDATTADAVLGRLLGIEAQKNRPEKPFQQLFNTLHIESGVESE